ncbi:MAG: alpha/beta fold hydrolase [Actinomycetales bacterium]|nr:alpha/beta fold hydrolase [Actinomycetales bacterium]
MGGQAGTGERGAQRATLMTADGIAISAVHYPDARRDGLCLVVVHGFTGHWRQPRVRRVIDRLRGQGAVVAIDMRGHGASGGASTVGDAEVRDVDAAVAWARALGYRRVVTVGFSMGASVVVRQAAVGAEAVDAVVCVSGPATWYYRGTRVMRLVHHLVLTPHGRAVLRLRGTRISSKGWPTPPPLQPIQAAAHLGDTPLLIVHGTADHYFPLEHPRALVRAARQSGHPDATMWIVPGFGHAEAAIGEDVIDAIATWCAGDRPAPGQGWLTQ